MAKYLQMQDLFKEHQIRVIFGTHLVIYGYLYTETTSYQWPKGTTRNTYMQYSTKNMKLSVYQLGLVPKRINT